MRELNCGERLTTPAGIGAGISWHTPVQQNFRTRAAGRWISDIVDGTHAATSQMRINADGTVDVVSLDCDGTHWIDLGGSGARDFMAGRY